MLMLVLVPIASGVSPSSAVANVAPPPAPPSPPPATANDRGGGYSAARDGLCVRLVLDRPTMIEGGEVSTDIDSRLDGVVHIRNLAAAPRRYFVNLRPAHALTWKIEGEDGSRWRPTFLPPPMPRPDPPPQWLTLAPGEERPYGHVHGVSGYERADRASDRHYQVLPAGRYAITLEGITVGGVDGTLASKLPLLVVPAAQAVDGLRLWLRAEAQETHMAADGRNAQPVRLHLAFKNVGQQPLRLDLYDLLRQRLELRVQGGSQGITDVGAPRPRPATASDYPLLAPGQSLEVAEPIEFPGRFGNKHYALLRPDSYQLKVIYRRGKDPAPAGLAAGCWTGEVVGDLVWLKVLPAKK
jgi:hypothetical protein